jgi:hypothetical protein
MTAAAFLTILLVNELEADFAEAFRVSERTADVLDE